MTQVRENWRYESSFMQQKYASLAPLIALIARVFTLTGC